MKRTRKVQDAYSPHYDWIVETVDQEIEELVDLGSLYMTREEYHRNFINKYQEDYNDHN